MQPERSEDAALLDEALSAFVSVRPRLFGAVDKVRQVSGWYQNG